MLCDLKVMKLGGIHRIQLADVLSTATTPHHNRAAFAVDFGDRSGFKDEVAVGKNLGNLRHDSCGEGVLALEFTFGFVPVLNGASDGRKALGVILGSLFVFGSTPFL